MSRARAWCFTINNYTIEEINACDEIECNYIIYGDEIEIQELLIFKDILNSRMQKPLQVLENRLEEELMSNKEEELLLKHPIIVKTRCVL